MAHIKQVACPRDTESKMISNVPRQRRHCDGRRLSISLGSKDPNNRALGPKYHNLIGIWDLNPHYLGLWTL